MTPHPHHTTSSIFHCYPSPSTTPLKILIIHLPKRTWYYALRTFELTATAHTVLHKYIQIWLHLLMTHCRKISLFLSKKILYAIAHSNLMKKNHKTKVKSREEAQKIGCFSRQILNVRENQCRNPLIFSITRVLVYCFTFWVISTKIYQSLFEKIVSKHYKMARNYSTDSYITSPRPSTWNHLNSRFPAIIKHLYSVSFIKKTWIGTTNWEIHEISRLIFFIKVVRNKKSKFFSHRYLIEFYETNRMNHVPHLYDVIKVQMTWKFLLSYLKVL